eukprot:c9680_g1_i1.p1 GENE.c9680_g1_i1~~c9680_g1_i1.p1  ORF type:complete len:612 (+),score=91.69 c9680_g1_i1:271-1836(+)
MILACSASELSAAILAGRCSAEEAVRAYIDAAVRVNSVTNSISELMIDSALARARALDADFANTHMSSGPLHGVPISLKEQIVAAGTRATCGAAALSLHPPATEDGLFTRILLAAGAIPFAKTTVPQYLFSSETASNLHGVTRNPYNPERSPGGSSGGEAALIGGGGSVLGFGTDIGGSLRGPAAACGIVAIKPTPARISSSGITKPFTAQQTLIKSVAGPMGRSVSDCEAALRVLIAPAVWAEDFTPTPLPYRESLARATAPLRIGYYVDDGYCAASSSFARAIDDVRAKLETLGHTLVPFTVPAVHEAVPLFGAIILADGFDGFESLGQWEPLIRQYWLSVIALSLPKWLRVTLVGLLRLVGLKRMAALASKVRPRSVPDFHALSVELEAYQNTVWAAWRAAGLDACISPAFGVPAYTHGASALLNPAFASYNFAPINLANAPAGVVPVTHVHSTEQSYPVTSDPVTRRADAMLRGAAGLPVAVQVYARPFDDETVVRVMRDVESVVRGGDFVPMWRGK